MSRSRRWSPRFAALVASAAIVFGACGGATTTTAPSAGTATDAPTTAPASSEPFEATSYPEDGSSACGTEGYAGQMGSIKAIDAKTIEFTLCAPDAAFLSKVAFTSLAINDSEVLTSTGGGGEALVRNPIGTGPVQARCLDGRARDRAQRLRRLLG